MNTTTRKTGMPGQQAQSRGTATVGERRATIPQDAVTPEHIRARAYEIFRARNGAPGDPVSDWVQAERELNGAARGATTGAEVEAKAQARGEALLSEAK